MRIQFVVTYTKGKERKRIVSEDYKTAFEYFEEKSETYDKVRLYREKTVIEADLLLSTY